MSVQEREEIDFQPCSEYQNAFAVSSMRHAEEQAATRGEIERLVEAGRVVVVAEVPVHCPITDACMGYRLFAQSHHATEAEAREVIAELREKEVGDIGFFLRGGRSFDPVPMAVDPAPAIEDDVPF